MPDRSPSAHGAQRRRPRPLQPRPLRSRSSSRRSPRWHPCAPPDLLRWVVVITTTDLSDLRGPVSSTPSLGRELSSAVVLFHQAVAARVRLSAGDLKTLELIDQEGPFSATQLARRTGLTPAAITSLVGRLAAGGHVQRETDPADRRRAIIRAVPSTNPELDDAFARLGGALGGLIAEYTPEQQAAITDYLRRMITVLREQTVLLGDAHHGDGQPDDAHAAPGPATPPRGDG
ncbi:MarR family transcriptional regulator [Cellulomonas sp. zg-ZUI188]|uniref:MarR family transcriptional regulator n=1 Tax=Cellulomonas fengjieae TaxID=2819978 RepID=A0ABS3SDA1_9CELL|nr:MarR family transcriptional regulator [Cellulomonas fengjieae]QVI64969.1 MarR family transcriptional regulator [Cellulomonas fengjieae]